MKNTKTVSYRILVEKERQGKKEVYVAYAPSLGVSDFGSTIEKAVANIEKAIKLYIDTSSELNQPIPDPDLNDYFITTRKVELSKNAESSFI